MSVTQQRLRTQRLVGPGFAAAADAVRWFGAVQAQDYRGALWALGLRTKGATEASVEHALADRTIVRTWPLRGTLHFVAPADVRWMLTHFGPRTLARAAPRFKQLELDERVFARSAAIMVGALEGGRQLSRQQLYALFERAGIATADNRGVHILFRAAHDGLICFAAPDGKQQTLALLDEWVPRAKALDRDEALAELARRYFTSHGPASLQDFTWWSGLSAGDARTALELARPGLERTHGSAPATYGGSAPAKPPKTASPRVVLLPPYDEYMVAYRDRSAALDPAQRVAAKNGIFGPTIVVNGRIAGMWSRAGTRTEVTVKTRVFTPLRREARALTAAVERYRTFARPASRLDTHRSTVLLS